MARLESPRKSGLRIFLQSPLAFTIAVANGPSVHLIVSE